MQRLNEKGEISLNGKGPIAVAVTLVVTCFSLAFAAGVHVGDRSIHMPAETKAAMITEILGQHASQPHDGAVTRQEYRDDITEIRSSIREIRDILREIQRGD